MSAWRQLRAIAPLPGVVTVLVPPLVLLGSGANATLPSALLGIALIAAGFVLWLWTVRLFARIGKGTLAPWDPPRKLVVEGPYRHVRNPMITAVLMVLAGEAVLFWSLPLLFWFALFFAGTYAVFRLFEEPELEQRFGEEYREYKRNVPRWLPRRSPWVPPRGQR